MAEENPDSVSSIFFQTYLLDSEVDIVRRIANRTGKQIHKDL